MAQPQRHLADELRFSTLIFVMFKRDMDVEPKTGVVFTPKMDGENNGSKPYEQMG